MKNPGSSRSKDREFLASGGEMAKLVRSKDWSRTPLGPIESWPQSLRTTVSLCLASNFPISIAWGPQRTQIYNDGYWPICGAKHPGSMGQDFKECWFSAWPVIGEAFESASAGEAAFLENQRLFIERNGYLEEAFFTFSFSPIRDESGNVVGLFHPVTELTQQSLAERRLKVLRAVAERAAEAKTLTEACSLIAHTLGTHQLDVPFALLYLLDPAGGKATLAGAAGIPGGAPFSPESIDLSAPAAAIWPLAETARGREATLVEDLPKRLGPIEHGPYPEPPHTAIVLPILISSLEQPIGIVVAGVSPRRALDETYRTFYRMLREAVTAVLTNARSYEEERKRAEALAELDRAKTAFFSNVSHEFRTPLTLMLGPLEDALAREGELPAGVRGDLEAAHRNSLRLLKLVNTMLDFSRIEAGRIQASYEPVDLAAYTAELASVFRSAIERAEMRLTVSCSPLPEPIYVDRDMWEKVVLNLLSNAFKFTLEGEIEVRLEATEGAARLTVRDTGVGIPDEELPRMFERFHRVENTRGRTHEGAGIGLALVQELVKLHGGDVRVESAFNRGSRFIVTIPQGKAHLDSARIQHAPELVSTRTASTAYLEEALRWLPDREDRGGEAAAQPREEAFASDAPRPAPNAERPRILWADDNADMREYVSRLLGERFEVQAVADGQAALDAARANRPDLVLSDIMMPRLDGFGLMRAIRADPELQEVPIVLVSARAGEEARIAGVEAGADDYLIKPFSARELLARVEAQTKLARFRREARETLRGMNETLLAVSTHQRELTERAEQNAEALRLAEAVVSEQSRILALIARNQPLEHCFEELCLGIERIDPGVRACILVADDARAYFTRIVAPRFPQFAEAVESIPIGDGSAGTCARAVIAGEPVVCADIEASSSWADDWRRLCLAHDVRACFSTPIVQAGAVPFGSVFLCFDRPKEPTDWDHRLAQMATGVAFVTLQREWSEGERQAELADSRLLQRLSAELVRQEDAGDLYEKIIDAAAGVMHSDFASLQMLHPERGTAGELHLLAFRGFNPEAAKFWEWVGADSQSTCAIAMRTGRRSFAPDVETFVEMAGTEDLAMYRHTGIRAVQTTPLISRGGVVVGMISTHWRQPHQPGERELRTFDLLARQGADLIERKHAEEALREADRRKDDFLAILGHELRNPLAPIRTGLEVLKIVRDDPAKLEETRGMMTRQTEQLITLVDDLLDVSRITRGKLELRKRRVALSEVVRSAVEASRPILDALRHELAVELPPEPVFLDADPNRLAQALSNILNNAAKYTPGGGRIRLDAGRQGADVVIGVQDNGVGIPPEQLERIFEMFSQVGRPQERGQGGLGIGLALVKTIVEMHGGAVEAHSGGAGQGAAFRVRLPTLAADESAAFEQLLSDWRSERPEHGA